MNTLIMGGTSGLGLEIAKRESEHSQVMVAGRHDPALDSDGSALGYASEFRAIDLARDPLNQNVEGFVATLPYVDNLVYAPGFYQEGHIDDLGDDEVDRMLNVCQRGLIFTVKKLLERQVRYRSWLPLLRLLRLCHASLSRFIMQQKLVQRILVMVSHLIRGLGER